MFAVEEGAGGGVDGEILAGVGVLARCTVDGGFGLDLQHADEVEGCDFLDETHV